MDDIDDSDVPKTGAVFTYGLSRFADNEPGKFWVRNDKVVQVACGEEHTVLITESGRAFSFGKNDWGQLGVGKNFSVHNKPSCIKALKAKGEKVRLVACGRNHTLLATESGSLYGMGNNVEKQVAAEVEDIVAEPHLIHSGQDFMALAAGGEMSAALLTSGQVLTWGSNAEGQCGVGDEDAGLDPVVEPTRVSLPGRVVSLSCGYYHAAAVLDDGRLFTWGEADGGKLGLIHVTSSQLEPQEVPVVEPIRSVSCGNNHTVAVAASGRLYVWGEGPSGQLGLGQEWESVKEPTRVKFTSPEICIATAIAGESHTIALSERGCVFVCGDDRRGKLGLQTSGPSGDSRCVWLPTEVSRFRNSGISVYAAASGGCHSVLLGVPDPHAPPASPCTPPPGALQHELSPTESSATASLEAPRPHARRRPRDENPGKASSLPPLRRPNAESREEDLRNGEKVVQHWSDDEECAQKRPPSFDALLSQSKPQSKFDDMILDDDSEEESKRIMPPRPARRSSRSMKSVTPSPRANDRNGPDLLLDDNNQSNRQFDLRKDDEEELQPKTRRRAKPGMFNKGYFEPEEEEDTKPAQPTKTQSLHQDDPYPNAEERVSNRQAEENPAPIENSSHQSVNNEKVNVGCGGRKASTATAPAGDSSESSKSCVMI